LEGLGNFGLEILKGGCWNLLEIYGRRLEFGRRGKKGRGKKVFPFKGRASLGIERGFPNILLWNSFFQVLGRFLEKISLFLNLGGKIWL